LALISVSSRSIVSFGPKLLGMVVNPSTAIAQAPHLHDRNDHRYKTRR
jgi:hypothetical protein